MKNSNLFLASALLIAFAFTSFSIPGERNGTSENPVKLIVLYGHPQDPAAFEEYYVTVHAGIAEKMRGVSRMELTKFENGADGNAAPYYRMAELYFPSVEAMQKTLDSPEGKATVGDLENFATGGVTVLNGQAEDFQFRP